MANTSQALHRQSRVRTQEPASVPWHAEDGQDLVVVDSTWGVLQPIQCAPNVPTFGELELIEAVEDGAVLVDSRLPGSRAGVTIPGAVNIPHDQILESTEQLDPSRLTVLFCNGPQCPQSPQAIRALLEAGYPAAGLAYYRGGLHDWVTLAMPVASVSQAHES
ncbi:MAG TPA: rhodanese-like domain-containing protein [Enteractinococcus sp.]